MSEQIIRPSWPHAPRHILSEGGAFIVTASTYKKQHLFQGGQKLDYLQAALLNRLGEAGWELEAWAVFPNHYHFVGQSPSAKNAEDLREIIKGLHSDTARWVNSIDDARGRQVWHNYWESHLTFQTSYLARLNYVHQNPVRHGLVTVAKDYAWCSAEWFERTATRAQVQEIYSFKTDSVNVRDDFE